MINYLTQEEYENQLMIHQISDIESEILINNEENQQPDLGRKLELHSRQVPITTLRKQNVGRKAINQPVVPVTKPVFVRNQPQPRKPVIKSQEAPISSFNFESELSKIKVPIPLLELLKISAYKDSFLKILQPTLLAFDSINLQEENPTIYLGSLVQEVNDDNPTPFYLSLNIHDKLLHNCLLDSGASHNLMPKKVMDELGLQITREYHDLFTFDSSRVHCIGLIKDRVVSLAQLPMKSIIMDIVVADIPSKFDMLLSRSWSKKLGGTLQMDMSYATVPIFWGEFRRLYRETKLAYIVSDHQNPTNHPIYAKERELGSSILHLTDESDSSTSEILKQQIDEEINDQNSISNQLWKLYFDGSFSREGVVLISPTNQVITLSFKLQFLTTNNTAENEALILGMKAAKDLGVEKLVVFGDAELVMQQVKKIYQVKQHKLKDYRNEVWDLVEHYFSSFNISYISREMNKLADSLDVAVSSFKVPLEPKDSYEIHIKRRPSIPDNLKH